MATAKSTARPAGSARKTRSPFGVWTSRRHFVFAAAAAAIWLNNLYQLPYLASQHGGIAFILLFLIGAAFIGFPLMIAELAVGQFGRASAVASFANVLQQVHGDARFRYIGGVMLTVALLALSYYSVIGGWALGYFARASVGAFSGLTLDGVGSLFASFVADPEKQLFWYSVFVVMTLAVGAQGLHNGIERFTQYLLPISFVLLLVLVVYAALQGSFVNGLALFLEADVEKLTWDAILLALTQGFFSVTAAFGVYLAYGARLPADGPTLRLAFYVLALDVVFALLAGAFVFPLISAAGFEPAPGLGLLFQTLPVAFDQLPIGGFMRGVFTLLMVLVMWMSAIGLVEPLFLWLEDRFRLARRHSVWMIGGVVWTIGLLAMLSFHYFAFSFSLFGIEKTLGFFDVMLVVTNLLLPFIALALALIVGWRLRRLFTQQALHVRSLCAHDIWVWSLRIITPILVLMVLINLPRIFA